MDDEYKANYYAVIPAHIRYNQELKFAERLLYGEITALSTKEGYCFASNRYFADLYNVSISTISRWISHLVQIGSIDIKIIRNEKNEVVERRLYIIDPYMQKNQYPYVQNDQYPIRKKVKDNNININRIDRLFNFVINKEEKIPIELNGINLKRVFDTLKKFDMLYTKEMLNIFSKDNLEKIKIIIYVLIDLTIRDKNLQNLSRERLFVIYDKCKNNNTEIVNFYDYYLTSIINELYKP